MKSIKYYIKKCVNHGNMKYCEWTRLFKIELWRVVNGKTCLTCILDTCLEAVFGSFDTKRVWENDQKVSEKF